MARLQLNKSSLARESRELQRFQRFLPSLELKRQQLMLEKASVVQAAEELGAKLDDIFNEVKQQLPMLSHQDIDLENLVATPQVCIKQENVLGVHLPCVAEIRHQNVDYNLLARPHWVDNYVELMRAAIDVRINLEIQAEKNRILTSAIKTITQRVNLFEKVLIPQAKENIKRIRIYLSDEQMTAVVRSKIAKGKRVAQGVTE